MGAQQVNHHSWFTRFATATAHYAGHPVTFIAAVGSIILWAILGPVFHFSDTWQLVINTATTIITFLMVFLIQNTQNRDAVAMHLKLAELIRSHGGADNALMDIEELEVRDLEELHREYESLAEKARHQLDKRRGEGQARHEPLSKN